MCQWTATAQANATPEQLLEILTHPEEIRRWSPVDFTLLTWPAVAWPPVPAPGSPAGSRACP